MVIQEPLLDLVERHCRAWLNKLDDPNFVNKLKSPGQFIYQVSKIILAVQDLRLKTGLADEKEVATKLTQKLAEKKVK